MSTTAARDYLYSYIFRSEPKPALERPSELQFFSTLEDCRALLSALGNPEQKLRIVHVAGTNGKGSTCALISAALQHAGHRVGQLSSPHLSDLRERIRLGRDWIPAEALESLALPEAPRLPDPPSFPAGEAEARRRLAAFVAQRRRVGIRPRRRAFLAGAAREEIFHIVFQPVADLVRPVVRVPAALHAASARLMQVQEGAQDVAGFRVGHRFTLGKIAPIC